MRFMLLMIAVAVSHPAEAAAQEEPAVPRAGEDAARDVELDIEEARTRFHLARLHFERGLFAEAARGFEAANAIAPRPELLFNAYLSWRDAGEFGRAAAALRLLLELPELPPSLSREALEQSHGERRALEQRVEVQESQLRSSTSAQGFRGGDGPQVATELRSAAMWTGLLDSPSAAARIR